MSRNIVVIRLGALLAMGVACVSVALAHQEPGDVTKEVEKIAAMSPDELRAYERRLVHELANLELVPPWITTNPPPRYAKARQNFGMNGGIAETPKGRLWAVWFGGEDGPKAFAMAAYSDDRGETWSETAFVVDTHFPNNRIDWLPVQRSIKIAELWSDPKGRMHLFVNQSLASFDGRATTWEFVCENPDADVPDWGKPRYIWHGGMHNKMLVLKDGTWLLPVELESDRGRVFPELDPLRGLGFFASTDEGKTWTKRGFTRPDHRHFAEQMAVERKDGTLWMLLRTGEGLMESFSSDKGWTWTKPVLCANLKQPIARFSFIRLQSGNLLFVKNGNRANAIPYMRPDEKITWRRAQLTAFLSEDEGKTWIGGLELDGRDTPAYPDAMQAKDGTIFVTYEYNRTNKAKILCARFTEEDVKAGKVVSPKSAMRLEVCAYDEKVGKAKEKKGKRR